KIQMSRHIPTAYEYPEVREPLLPGSAQGFFGVDEAHLGYYRPNGIPGTHFMFPESMPNLVQYGGYLEDNVSSPYSNFNQLEPAIIQPHSETQNNGIRFILEDSLPTVTTGQFLRRHSLPEPQLNPREPKAGKKANRQVKNRAAAVRCRVRKASWVKETREKLEKDRQTNKALLKTIANLQQEIFTIHCILSTASSVCPSTYRPRNRLPPDNID
ncbi:hypothetical protein L0F63_005340, partial [Massospora cicadina]